VKIPSAMAIVEKSFIVEVPLLGRRACRLSRTRGEAGFYAVSPSQRWFGSLPRRWLLDVPNVRPRIAERYSLACDCMPTSDVCRLSTRRGARMITGGTRHTPGTAASDQTSSRSAVQLAVCCMHSDVCSLLCMTSCRPTISKSDSSETNALSLMEIVGMSSVSFIVGTEARCIRGTRFRELTSTILLSDIARALDVGVKSTAFKAMMPVPGVPRKPVFLPQGRPGLAVLHRDSVPLQDRQVIERYGVILHDFQRT